MADAPLTEFRTKLTEELLVELCRVHREGKDFRNVTAIRCGVHPKRLKLWLVAGARNQLESGLDLKTRLFLEFSRIEAELRAENIREVLDTQTKLEECHFDDEGKLTNKTTTGRSVSGVQWYMERRWRQWRSDWAPTEDDSEVALLLAEQSNTGQLSGEAALAVVAQLAEAMPPQLMAIFEAKGWTPPKLEAAHGSSED